MTLRRAKHERIISICTGPAAIYRTFTAQHIQLTLLSVAIAVCIGVPLGIYISERERLLRPVMGFANLAQAIPSLALLGFLVPYMGIGAVTAVAW